MEIGRVIGNVWATKKDEGISGQKLLVINVMKGLGQEKESLMVAADVIGAGIGDMVLVVRGTPARLVVGDGGTPVDLAVVAIIDSLDIPKPAVYE
ncbi:MAG: EutN/CcmL family microcompartment protein [Eubacteriales bacterium]|nr:EutN/CcmL family microcompartment protein [Eubacteriales bacterium]